MNLIKYFLKFFDVFFHRHNSLKKRTMTTKVKVRIMNHFQETALHL